jgi:hypothetical protein
MGKKNPKKLAIAIGVLIAGVSIFYSIIYFTLTK